MVCDTLTENHREYTVQPFLISATCKKELAEQHANILQLAWRACDERKLLTGGHVYCLASDGESQRGKALVALTEKSPLLESSLIYPHLHSMRLLNRMVGDQDITSNKDYKHVMKCLQHAHLHPKGVQVGPMQITPSILQRQLESAGTSVVTIHIATGYPQHISHITSAG